MMHGFVSYIRYWENWLQWSIVIGIFLCTHNALGDINSVVVWQHHVAAVVIFLAWLELMMLVGRFPIFGLYVQMFTTVAVNFSKFLMAYCCLLVAFGLSFCVLFPNHIAFKGIPRSLLKTIVMMAGELEFEDIFYGENLKIEYPATAHGMFLAFVLLVTVILTNLLVGLAVSDIQGLQQSAGLDRLSRQAELISRLESLMFSKLLRKAPIRIWAIFQKIALLKTSRCRLHFRVKPNDPREKRVGVMFECVCVQLTSRDATLPHTVFSQSRACVLALPDSEGTDHLDLPAGGRAARTESVHAKKSNLPQHGDVQQFAERRWSRHPAPEAA
uniref:Putative transient receptor potential channel pyrexia n=1 Tax=Anopheles darlingi TaxID=43151 RepID=A0A2M4DP03_ANODA